MSESVTIYHNPRCSKSRQALQLLEERGLKVKVVNYLVAPPSKATLLKIVSALGIKTRDLLRKNEVEYRQLGLGEQDLSDTELLEAMVRHPKLIERPIVTKGARAALGRPPENVLQLLD